MTGDIRQHVVAQIPELLKAKQGIVFGMDMPDNENSELHWSQYRLTETKEIAVTYGSQTAPGNPRTPGTISLAYTIQ